MDQYGNNNTTNTNLPTTSSYSSLPSIAPQQLQQNTTRPPHTLPPLQAQHAALSMHSMYGQQPLSAPHTPTSTQPNTPGSTGNGGFQQMTGQPAPRNYHLQQNSPYQQQQQQHQQHQHHQQPIQPYNNSSAMIPQGSGPMSHPHPQARMP